MEAISSATFTILLVFLVVSIDCENNSSGCIKEQHLPFKMPTDEVIQAGGNNTEKIRINQFYSVHRDRFYIRNTGNSLEFQVQPDTHLFPTMDDKIPNVDQESEPRIRGASWPDQYVLARGYFHWQIKNLTIKNPDGTTVFNTNATAPPLEMELVHYAKKYKSLDAAVKSKDGILVTAHLFELVGRDNPALEPIARSSLSVAFPNKKFKQVHGPLDIKLLFPSELSYCEFYGLYPLNPCANNARFLVFKKPLFVSTRQLKRFGWLRAEDGQKISDKQATRPGSSSADPPTSKCSSNPIYLAEVNQISLPNTASFFHWMPAFWIINLSLILFTPWW